MDNAESLDLVTGGVAVTGYLLAGGRSSRMGRDKSTLQIPGGNFFDLAAKKLSMICGEFRISGGSPRSPFVSIADVHPNRGAPGGVHSILADCETEFALVLAIDLPFVSVDILQKLIRMIDDETDAVVPRQPDGRIQPLAAVYRVSACLPIFENALAGDAGTPSMKRILNEIRLKIVDVADLGVDDDTFFNVNTPADFEQSLTIFHAKSAALDFD